MISLSLPLFGVLLPGAVSHERCASLRASLSARGFRATGGGYPAGYRDNDRLVLDDDALAAEIWALPALQGALGPLDALGSSWRPVAANRRFRACRYEGGQSFTRHRDGAWLASPDQRTFLTAQLYLDDDFRGGATRFYERPDDADPAASVVPRQGAIVLFDHRLWHDGEAVTQGRKHVLRTDIVFERCGPAILQTTGDAFVVAGAPYVFAVLARRDGTLAVGTREGRVLSLADVDGALRPRRTIALGPSSVTALAEDADGRLFAGSRAGVVKRLDEQGEVVVWRTDSAITALAATADGILVATAGGTLTRLAGRSDTATVIGRLGGWAWAIEAPAPGSADRRALIASDAGLFAVDEGSSVLQRQKPGPLRAVARTRAGQVFTGDAGGELRGPTDVVLARHRGAITALAADGADGVVSGGEDGALFHVRSARGDAGEWDVARRAAHDDFVRSIAVLSDGTVVSGGYDGAVRTWRSARMPLATE